MNNRTYAPHITPSFIGYQENKECYDFYNILQKYKNTPILECYNTFLSFFHISDDYFLPDDSRCNYERKLREFVSHINKLINQKIHELYHRHSHISYYTSINNFKFSKLRIVPEILIIRDYYPLRKCFFNGIRYDKLQG